jgi:hypothetical protein
VKRSKRSRKAVNGKEYLSDKVSEAQAGGLWIDPKLNRTVAGAGGNRGEHTTSSAKLLHLADIALKKDA